MTSETFDQSDEDIWHDPKKDNDKYKYNDTDNDKDDEETWPDPNKNNDKGKYKDKHI